MPTPWAARLGLVSMSVLALAACNRNQPAQSAANSDAAMAVAGSDMTVAPAADTAEPLPASQAAASVAPAPTPAAVAAAPEIAAAQSLDQAVTSGGADTQAYGFQDNGEQVRVWDDAGRGSRIVMPGGAISYYRPGAADPYLMRQGDAFYVLSGGRVVRAYDARGRAMVLQPAARTRVETVITRTRTVRHAAEQRRPPAAPGRSGTRDASKVQAAQDNARDAGHDARQADKQADKARDSAQDAQHAANRAERQADTPRQEDKAKDAQREANKADRQADKAADKAKDASQAARDARQLAAQCARQKARGQKVDNDCKG